jgi:ribosomal protein S18 acetylase RimI-like enzyme
MEQSRLIQQLGACCPRYLEFWFPMNFRDHLSSIYYENPCQVLPNALWKTLAQLDSMKTSISIEKDVVSQIAAWNEKSLMFYWTRNREYSQDFFQEQNDLNLALIHQDYLHAFPSQQFAIRTPYFRLIHRQNDLKAKVPIPSGFSIIEVNIQQESEQVAHLIGQCYQDIYPTVETVTNWSKHPTFDPSLWVWIFDNTKRVPVGLGIAEVDIDILEGSLEWIQVLPSYRGIGLGKVIVQELLSRLGKRVEFTTVSGETDNTTKPESLYRSCGFEGNDVWWMFGAG